MDKTPFVSRIIGIDPGSRKTGYGVIDVDERGRIIRHVDHGILRLNVEEAFPVRAQELAERLLRLFEQHQPSKAGIEDVFVRENPRSALVLGQARGVALAALGIARIPVISVVTTKVKQHVAGTGHATKAQIAQMVRLLLKLDALPPEDAADALAIAICVAGFREPLHAVARRPSSRQKDAALLAIARAQGKI